MGKYKWYIVSLKGDQVFKWNWAPPCVLSGICRPGGTVYSLVAVLRFSFPFLLFFLLHICLSISRFFPVRSFVSKWRPLCLTLCVAAIVPALCSVYYSSAISIYLTIVTLLRRVLDRVHSFVFYLLGDGYASCIRTPKMLRDLRREFCAALPCCLSVIRSRLRRPCTLLCFRNVPVTSFCPATECGRSGFLFSRFVCSHHGILP
jgi:hypothetical protein